MGVTAEDVITSAPSSYGALCAVNAASLWWPAALLIPVFGAAVSDPAQIWHLAERCWNIAGHIRTASEEMTSAVKSCANEFHWNEKGKDAFMATRVTPYQSALHDAAGNFDALGVTLAVTAAGYTGLGLLSATVGSALLTTVTAGALAGVAAPGTALITNARIAQIMKVVLNALRTIARYNGKATKAIVTVLQRQELSTRGILALGAAGSAGVDFAGSPWAMNRVVDDVQWPKELPAGAAVPSGYEAPTADQRSALKQIRPESIVALAKRLDATADVELDAACKEASDLHVGVPGFGVCGIPVDHVLKSACGKAMDQLTAARDTPGTWLPGLRTNAGNWVAAEHRFPIRIEH
ncbi:hypothetical protein [Actinoallomurus rhizosphaericola]|uniref:hypothetical protein n=1 Tax=Actinoallomurus rhizosphaericola TaxID=2952536 RepID=UPI0020920620|nr:hypothetical protein [Actinoallomurus rhizosphaericola]MCO5996313.1 hypothetical protein [Actinoallomurus rhizosphaericola]